MDYTPNFDWGSSLKPTSAQNAALGAAKNTLGDIGGQTYTMPDWYGSQMQAPAQQNYYQTQSVSPLQNVELPTYQTFQGNDFQSWEDAIKNAAQQDINAQMGKTQTGMQNVMGGGGLYGSSIQADQMVNLGDAWARALGNSAAGAKTQRMQMEQDALNNQNQWNLSAANLGLDQNKAIWQANAAEQSRMDQYNQGAMDWNWNQQQMQNDFQNQQLAGQYQHDQLASDWKRMIDDELFNKQMALATGSMPGANASLAYQANLTNSALQNQQFNKANDYNQNSDLWSGIGGALGGYLGLADSQNSWNPLDWF